MEAISPVSISRGRSFRGVRPESFCCGTPDDDEEGTPQTKPPPPPLFEEMIVDAFDKDDSCVWMGAEEDDVDVEADTAFLLAKRPDEAFGRRDDDSIGRRELDLDVCAPLVTVLPPVLDLLLLPVPIIRSRTRCRVSNRCFALLDV